MMLEEMQARCKCKVTQDDLEHVTDAYLLLDFDKDTFCKLIDAIGLETWTNRAAQWARLRKAEEELTAKERYQAAVARKQELAAEQEHIDRLIASYEHNCPTR